MGRFWGAKCFEQDIFLARCIRNQDLYIFTWTEASLDLTNIANFEFEPTFSLYWIVLLPRQGGALPLYTKSK